MAAANTDKLKKLSRRWVGQIGVGGVSDASTTTVPLSSSTNLPSDTAVVVVIDRVDANGTSTPSLEETVIGVVSGSNLINCVRGSEGTAQAHNAGAVVEVLVTAKGWNDIIDWGLIQHSQGGYHTNLTACNITMSHVSASDISALYYTGSGIDTDGTLAANSDLKIPTQKAVKTYVTANSGSADGWITDSDTYTYVSASSFKVSGKNVTTRFTKGTRVKLTQTTVKYFVVTSSSFSTDTTVNIAVNTDYTIANAAITSPFYSYEANPQGYPITFNYSVTWTCTSTNPVIGNGTLTGVFNVLGNQCMVYIAMTAGDSTTFGTGTEYSFSLPITAISSALGDFPGPAYLLDASAGTYVGTTLLNTATTLTAIVAQSTAQSLRINPTNIATWTTSDVFKLRLTYTF